jgi:hypothetical protein
VSVWRRARPAVSIIVMSGLTPQGFARRWSESRLSERSSYQQHFLDLCAMLGQPTPAELDPTGDFYMFEKGVEKTGGWPMTNTATR